MCEAEQWDEAREELQRLREFHLLTPDKERAWTAQILLGEGKNVMVLALGQAGIVKGDLLAAMAIASARLGRREEARRLASDYLEGRNQGAERVMGRVVEALDGPIAALDWYDRAVRRVDRKDTLRPLAAALFAAGDYRESAWAYSECLRNYPYLRTSDVDRLVESLRRSGRQALAAKLEAAFAVRCLDEDWKSA